MSQVPFVLGQNYSLLSLFIFSFVRTEGSSRNSGISATSLLPRSPRTRCAHSLPGGGAALPPPSLLAPAREQHRGAKKKKKQKKKTRTHKAKAGHKSPRAELWAKCSQDRSSHQPQPTHYSRGGQPASPTPQDRAPPLAGGGRKRAGDWRDASRGFH